MSNCQLRWYSYDLGDRLDPDHPYMSFIIAYDRTLVPGSYAIEGTDYTDAFFTADGFAYFHVRDDDFARNIPISGAEPFTNIRWYPIPYPESEGEIK